MSSQVLMSLFEPTLPPNPPLSLEKSLCNGLSVALLSDRDKALLSVTYLTQASGDAAHIFGLDRD